MRAFVFGPAPLFWPFWHRTSRTLLPGLHNARYWFLKPIKTWRFLKPKKNRPLFETDKLKLPPILPASKTTHWNYLPKEQPTKQNTHQTKNQSIRVFMFWTSRFCITLELSGPRQRVRLNDLLYAPLILTLNLCFDLFGYRTSRTLLPGLHGPNYWLLQPTKISFLKSKTDFEIQPPRRNRQNEIAIILPATKNTYPKNHPKEQHANLTFHQSRNIRTEFSCFDFWGFV